MSVDKDSLAIGKDKSVRNGPRSIVAGKFQWEDFGGRRYLPTVARAVDGQRVTFVWSRAAEAGLIRDYGRSLHRKVFSVRPVRAYMATDAETAVLTRLDRLAGDSGGGGVDDNKHCVVRADCLRQYIRFLDACVESLHSLRRWRRPYDGATRWRNGFLRIGHRIPLVPYCRTDDGQRYLPVRYFADHSGELARHAVTVRGWTAAHLRFCCLLQGRDRMPGLFDGDGDATVVVVSCELVRSRFPAGTPFRESWPQCAKFLPAAVAAASDCRRPPAWTRPSPWSTIDDVLAADRVPDVPYQYDEYDTVRAPFVVPPPGRVSGHRAFNARYSPSPNTVHVPFSTRVLLINPGLHLILHNVNVVTLTCSFLQNNTVNFDRRAITVELFA